METKKDKVLLGFGYVWKIVVFVVLVMLVVGIFKSMGPNDPQYSGVSGVQRP